MMIPGLKVVAPSSPIDVIGLLRPRARSRSGDLPRAPSRSTPQGECRTARSSTRSAPPRFFRPGRTPPSSLCLDGSPRPAAAEKLAAEHGIDCEVIDVALAGPLDTQTILGSVAKTPPLLQRRGKSAAVAAGVPRSVDHRRRGILRSRRAGWWRINNAALPAAAADILEDAILADVVRIVDRVKRTLQA